MASLRQLLSIYSEDEINEVFSRFRCSRDLDLEEFLHQRAISYEKRDLARVYLALTPDNEIVGYFSLSMRCGIVPKDSRISKSMYKHLNVQSETDVAQMYLIGQPDAPTVRRRGSGGSSWPMRWVSSARPTRSSDARLFA